MKRFYRDVGVEADDRGYRVLLDGRPLKTPAGQILVLPVEGLARAIAAEWRAQGETVEPTAMPVTRLATTARDHMPARRASIVQEIVDFAGTDLLCYRASRPDQLVRRQQQAWQPPLAWIARRYGIAFAITRSLLPTPQPKATIDGVRRRVEGVDDWSLIGLHGATTSLGSVILALALWHQQIDATTAADASLLDDLFELETWGQERDANRRLEVRRRDIHGAALFLRHLPVNEPTTDLTTGMGKS